MTAGLNDDIKAKVLNAVRKHAAALEGLQGPGGLMSGVGFFQTRMGARFYEGTLPKIAEQLERLNDNLEALLVELRRLATTGPASTRPSNGTAGPA